jgi:plasmid maintenance system antidote protein VapI
MGKAARTPWGERLHEALERDGRKASWLAECIGIGRSNLNHAMYGRRPLSEDKKRLIAAYMQRRYEDIFGEPELTAAK